eukprot:scaffold7844_cov137-Skeletonema_marinoi.AAC.1
MQPFTITSTIQQIRTGNCDNLHKEGIKSIGTVHHLNKLNICHEQVDASIADRLQADVISTFESDSKHNTEEILDGKLGQGLLDLPRLKSNERTNYWSSKELCHISGGSDWVRYRYVT